MLDRRDVERFWASVDQSGGEDSCWEWTRGRTAAGYGEFCAIGRTLYAHRVAFEIEHGGIAGGHYVCHRCDNPPCCNPRHLFSGPPQSNVDDKLAKGRQLRGERVALHVLSASDVLAIRLDYANRGTEQAELASLYGVNKVTIGDAIRGKTWAHVAGPITTRRVMTPELAAACVAMFTSGEYTKSQIARRCGFSKSTVGNLINGKRSY